MQQVAAGFAMFGGVPRLIFDTLFIDENWDFNVKEHQRTIAEQAITIVARAPQAIEENFLMRRFRTL